MSEGSEIPDFTLDQPRTRPRRQAGAPQSEEEMARPPLLLLARCYWYSGWFSIAAAIVGLLVGIIVALLQSSFSPLLSSLIATGTLLFASITSFALDAGIRVFLNIERNTRRSRDALERMAQR